MLNDRARITLPQGRAGNAEQAKSLHWSEESLLSQHLVANGDKALQRKMLVHVAVPVQLCLAESWKHLLCHPKVVFAHHACTGAAGY